MKTLRRVRRACYFWARLLGDVIAILSGRYVARMVNKMIGRQLRRLWR